MENIINPTKNHMSIRLFFDKNIIEHTKIENKTANKTVNTSSFFVVLTMKCIFDIIYLKKIITLVCAIILPKNN